MGRRLRGGLRLAILATSLLEALGRFVLIYVRRGRVSRAQRAGWLHAACARIARRLSIVHETFGVSTSAGLTVSNHLTYLDILMYGAVSPFVFVAKSEVRRWPLLGVLASLGGTIFVERSRSMQASEAGEQIEEALRDGIPVLLFPEGTSSDGAEVLPFRPALFEAAIRTGASVTPAAIRYQTAETAERAVTYWGEMVFVPHLYRTLCIRELRAEVRFDSPLPFGDRKTAARVAWQKVRELRAEMAREEMAEEMEVASLRR
jgi:lyso-ornithine lipid O-acyltransferase